jgi:Sigma54-dependent transcription regulator containing an AAA-type ATPase domain and a DNA-binding domain
MKKGLIIIFISLCLVLLVSSFGYVHSIPVLKEYGKMEIERFNQLIISHCYFTSESQFDELVIMKRGDNNEIELIDFDMVKVNQLASKIVLDIEQTYALLEEGNYHRQDDSFYQKRLETVSQTGIISRVPITTLFHLPVIPFCTPQIPIKYRHLSSVGSSVVKNIQNYGVNHVMVELSIEVHMNLTMVYPFFEQYHTHTITIPVLLEIFQGQVPLIYS